MTLKSAMLRKPYYQDWVSKAPPEEVAFVDAVYAEAEANYARGGDVIVECFTPIEIVRDFHDLQSMREFCGLKVEQALNARWGEDSDPEVKRAQSFQEWRKAQKKGS